MRSMTLSEYIAEAGLTQEGFAKLVGASQDEVSRWAAHRRTPRREMLVTIKEVTEGKVTADSFLEPLPAKKAAAA